MYTYYTCIIIHVQVLSSSLKEVEGLFHRILKSYYLAISCINRLRYFFQVYTLYEYKTVLLFSDLK